MRAKFRLNVIYLGSVLICLNERNSFDGLLSAINCLESHYHVSNPVEGGRGVLPKFFDRGVPRRFSNPGKGRENGYPFYGPNPTNDTLFKGPKQRLMCTDKHKSL